MLCSKCSEAVKPVVALDIDGTLANYHFHFLHFAYAWLGKLCGSKEMDYYGDRTLTEHLGIDKRTYRECKLAYRQGGLKRSMPTYPGAWRLVNELWIENVEVWLTTTRPYLRLDNIDPDTREWCRRNDIQFSGLLYDEDKYARLIEIVGTERIVAVLDDDIDQVERATELGLPAQWRRNKYNSKQVRSHDPPEYDNLMDFKDDVFSWVRDWRRSNGT